MWWASWVMSMIILWLYCIMGRAVTILLETFIHQRNLSITLNKMKTACIPVIAIFPHHVAILFCAWSTCKWIVLGKIFNRPNCDVNSLIAFMTRFYQFCSNEIYVHSFSPQIMTLFLYKIEIIWSCLFLRSAPCVHYSSAEGKTMMLDKRDKNRSV